MKPVNAVVFTLMFAVPLPAQSDLRAGEIEADRQAKSQRLTPDRPGTLERRMNWFENSSWVNGLLGGGEGLRVSLGGLGQSQGFAAGVSYNRRDLWNGRLAVRSSIHGSVRQAYMIDLGITVPRLAAGKSFVDVYSAHYNYPNMQFYGEGPQSSKNGRGVYRLENTLLQARSGFRLRRRLTIGATGGLQSINVGRGENSALGHTEEIYSDAQAPGVHRQSTFLQTGGYIQYDWRNEGAQPVRGGMYRSEYSVFSDRDQGRHNFNRLDLAVQQYLPLFHAKRVIAFQGATVLTDAHRGNTVPFYLQPVVGGAETLRGYRPFRFYGDNSMVLNCEYRFEASSLLDLALFADAGKVFQRWGEWNLHRLESDVGVGFRFKSQQRVVLRIDTAISQEGVMIWFRFNDVF
ncbi:MAG: BamA/TamA family outer membrane protein [Bryobacteraceae bacterium]